MEYLATTGVFAMHNELRNVHVDSILQPNNKINKGLFQHKFWEFALNFADRCALIYAFIVREKSVLGPTNVGTGLRFGFHLLIMFETLEIIPQRPALNFFQSKVQ